MWLALGLLAGALLHSCNASTEDSEARTAVLLFAAASTSGPVEQVITEFQNETGFEVRVSFAGSSTLARQIEQGAPADLFLCANPLWMNYLEERGRLADGSRCDLLGGRLVLIGSPASGETRKLEAGFDLPGSFTGRLAVGDPDHVPVGMYAREALQSRGWWQALQSRLAVALDSRAALLLVERSECERGIVYAADALCTPELPVLATFPASSHSPIVYPLTMLQDRDRAACRALYRKLCSAAAARCFERAGFRALAAEPTADS